MQRKMNVYRKFHSGADESVRDETEIATVQAAGSEDVDIAVKAAKVALKSPAWKLLPATDRGVLMNKLADLMEKNVELLATIDAWDNGKSSG